MFNLFKKDPVLSYQTINGKVVLIKEWPCKEDKSKSWGNSGYDRHVIK